MLRLIISVLCAFVLVEACDRIHKFYTFDEENNSASRPDSGHAVLLVNPQVKSAQCTEYAVSGSVDKLSWTYDDSKTGSGGVCSPTDQCGPSHWKDIEAVSPTVNMCGGKSQTPIDIKDKSVTGAYPEDITFSVTGGGCTTWTSFTDDHTVEISFSEAGVACGNHKITVGGKTYTLKQFHFHTPSEHTINGKDTAAELHFVHKTDAGEIAVLGVMLDASDTAPRVDVITELEQLIGANGDSAAAKGAVLHCEHLETGKLFNAYSLLPDVKDFYAYSGSLTTYPCTEGLSWFVYKKHLPVSKVDISVIDDAITNYSESIASPTGADARPIQPLNDRQILFRKAPKATKAPKEEKAAQASKAPKAAKSSKAPKASKSSKAPKAAKSAKKESD